jgi:hypothetical protein
MEVARVQFVVLPAREGRVHHIGPEDVEVVLARLGPERTARLRSVTFLDAGKRVRELGFVQPGHRDISLCALPAAISLNGFLLQGQSPERYGASWDHPWPREAIRRFLMYDVLLHEIAHMQIVKTKSGGNRRRFADEPMAHELAFGWCDALWRERFEHPDPAHNAPPS